VVVGIGGGGVRTRVVSIVGVVAVGKAGRVRWTVGDVDGNVAGEVGDGDVVVVMVTSVVDVNVDVGVVRGSAAGSTVVEGGGRRVGGGIPGLRGGIDSPAWLEIKRLAILSVGRATWDTDAAH
jgi:hypothetical protein